MAWKYKSPHGFPARYPEAMRQAAAKPSTPILLFSGDYESAQVDAEKFRHYRWCLRQKPLAMAAISSIELTYAIRTSCDRHGSEGLLYLTLTPSVLSDLSTLNPHLAGIVAEACQ